VVVLKSIHKLSHFIESLISTLETTLDFSILDEVIFDEVIIIPLWYNLENSIAQGIHSHSAKFRFFNG
jgi:hypothetical protein